MLFSIFKDPVILANDLNHDLNVICQSAAYRWTMEFNPDPKKHVTEILFTCKKSSPNHPQLIFNGTDVVNVSEHRHLDLILEPGLYFVKHLSDEISKAKKNVGILKHISKFLPLTICIKPLFVLILITAMSFITYHLKYICHPLVEPLIP